MSGKNSTLTVAPELLRAIKAAAQAEDKTPDEWLSEAAQDKLRRNHLDDRWQKLTERMQRHALEHGFKSEDVGTAIDESRLGQ